MSDIGDVVLVRIPFIIDKELSDKVSKAIDKALFSLKEKNEYENYLKALKVVQDYEKSHKL